jgi:hypothetical protein
MLKSFFQFFTSLRLTVVCLGMATLLVFVGTIAQVEQGLYQAQDRYFRSFFVYWSPPGASWGIPVFPGGYLIGSILTLNLIANYIRRYKFNWDNIGLLTVHLGLVLLLVGQLFTDLLSTESAMNLQLGETKNYSEDFFASELVVADTTDPDTARVVSIPTSLLSATSVVPLPQKPFNLQVHQFWPNAELLEKAGDGAVASGATEGVGRTLWVQSRPPTVKMDERNVPAATVTLSDAGQSLGTWLVSGLLRPQAFTHEGRSYEVAMRPKRHYAPYSLTLLDLRHDVYPGTDIPKNFSSRVRIENPQTAENREVLIYMNNPLRYQGLTYYQYQMAARGPVKSSTLQVVRNPGWLTPYLACLLVGAGLTWQFLAHLIGFLKQRSA